MRVLVLCAVLLLAIPVYADPYKQKIVDDWNTINKKICHDLLKRVIHIGSAEDWPKLREDLTPLGYTLMRERNTLSCLFSANGGVLFLILTTTDGKDFAFRLIADEAKELYQHSK